MTIQFKGMTELIRGLEDGQNMNKVKKVVKLNGSEMQRNMMRYASFTKGYQTGATKRSITLQFRDAGLSAEVRPTTDYSPYLELGTRYMAAQPFVRPAYYNALFQFHDDLKRLVE